MDSSIYTLTLSPPRGPPLRSKIVRCQTVKSIIASGIYGCERVKQLRLADCENDSSEHENKKTWLLLHNIDEKQMRWMSVSLFEAATVLTPTELQCNKLLASQAFRYHIISPINMLWISLKISMTFQSGKLPLNAINLVLEELRLKGQCLFCFTVMNYIQTSKAPDLLLLAWIMTRTIINKLLYIPVTKWALVGWFSHLYSEVWTAWLYGLHSSLIQFLRDIANILQTLFSWSVL